MTAPPSLAGSYEYGTAAFGPAPTPTDFSGSIVLGLDAADAAGPTVNDGCSAFANAAQVAGKIAVVRRGTCGFAVRAKNAQNAGATGVIVGNNVAGGGTVGMTGTDSTLTIPAISVANCGKGSGAPATLLNGQSLAGPAFTCANNAKNKDQFQSYSTQYFNALRSVGVIEGSNKGTFSSCTAGGK